MDGGRVGLGGASNRKMTTPPSMMTAIDRSATATLTYNGTGGGGLVSSTLAGIEMFFFQERASIIAELHQDMLAMQEKLDDTATGHRFRFHEDRRTDLVVALNRANHFHRRTPASRAAMI
eukprot:Lithocolla_globosa_v1_NODE_6_length_11976_cov_15.425432.p16 type:complete len:120 gc:universal NODE_6_length_11976_cov_15.425432:9644-9285(-)